MSAASHVVSVNVGRPREVKWHGRLVRTSIWKTPTFERVRVARLNIDGDEQSDLSVHGGLHKAVYAYPREHYEFWRSELPESVLEWGAFGENLTIEGLLEDDVRVGDRLRIGSVEFEVTQPRFPCFKLGIRFGRDDVLRRFLESGRSGFYLSVVKEGALVAGDAIQFDPRAEHDVTISDVAAAYATGGEDSNLLRRILKVPTLPGGLREHFARRLNA
jgi:MOSC domain-containing protein YiiM